MEQFHYLQTVDSFTPQGWMRMCLGLTNFKDVAAYAIIFGQSQARNMTGEEVRQHIAEWLDITPNYALRIINRLINAGLVACHIEVLIGNKRLRRYRVTQKYQECIKKHFRTLQAPCAGDKSIEPIIEVEEPALIIENNNNNIGGEEERSRGVGLSNENLFVKPSVAEIIAYCAQRGNGLDGAYIWNYYEAKGWMVGKSPMKDWQAAVRTWEQKAKARRASTKQLKALTEINNA